MDSVGQRIKGIRISKGITQADLANALDTTTAAISRYELGKRELRFAQVQTIAELLGVSVFELYGFPSEQQIQMENSQKILSLIEKQIQNNQEGSPDETAVRVNEGLRLAAEEIGKELQTKIKLAAVAHKAQVQASLITQSDEAKGPAESPQADPATKLQNKRVDDLVSMFTAYPRDAQNRILDVVSTFGKLNSVGQKRAVGRIKELAELPRYQAQQEGEAKE